MNGDKMNGDKMNGDKNRLNVTKDWGDGWGQEQIKCYQGLGGWMGTRTD